MACLAFLLLYFISSVSGRCTEEKGEIICPLGCQCSESVFACENARLGALPEVLPSNLSFANFRGNLLTRIYRRNFEGCTGLLELYLELNKIGSPLHPDTFRDLSQLKKLSLYGNKMDFSDWSPPLFSNLKSLVYLDVHSNLSPYDPTHWVIILQELAGLQTLVLDGNVNVTDWEPIVNLSRLETFHVYNYVDKIYNATFAMFSQSKTPNLHELGVHSNTLTNMEEDSFSHFTSLRTLDLSFNPSLGFRNMSVAWFGLRYTNVSELRLEAATPFETEAIKLEKVFFSHLNETKITKLNLDGNSIIFLKAKFHDYLPHLRYLSLAYNRIQNHAIETCLDILQLPQLTYLDVSHQSRRKVYQRLEHLPSKSEHVYNAFQQNATPVSKTDSENYHNKYIFLVPRKLSILLLDECSDIYFDDVPEVSIVINSELEYIDYSNNHISTLTGPCTLFLTRTHEVRVRLIFANNHAHYFNPDFFQLSRYSTERNYTIMADTVDFSNNNFGKQFDSDIDGRVWNLLKRFDVQKFHLANNGIRLLHKNSFLHFGSLQLLNLSSNSLRLVSTTLVHMTKLKIMDLSYNLLDTLSKETRQELDALAKWTSLEINLTGNPLECICETRDFLEWLKETKVIVVNWREYECSFQRKIIQLSRLETEIIPTLSVVCSSNALLIAGGSSIGTLIVIIAVSACIYRHRWDIRYVLLRLTRSRKLLQLQEQMAAYEFDAFVIFHSQDWHWVRNTLVHYLEEDGPQPRFKLCVHHRDWMPGTSIEENIQQSIESSRKTILVMTKEFATSGWCGFEAHMARVRSFEERLDIIVPIMLEDVPVELMNSTLKGIVRENTYIEWPSMADHNPQHRLAREFWARLRAALRNPGDRPLVCECGRRRFYMDSSETENTEIAENPE